MPSILKRLRNKFMLTTTIIVGIIVAIIAVTYCAGTYSSSAHEIELALEHSISASVGQSQPPPDNKEPKSFPEEVAIDEEYRIDLFRGRSALVYSVVIDSEGIILRNDSPAIGLDNSVLQNAITTVLESSYFSMDEGNTTTGRIASENLFYRTLVQGDRVYLALTDSSSLDQQTRDSVLAAVILSLVALFLTLGVSYFSARLFLRPVEDAWNKQRRFIADASHELKTPLTVIMANTEIVRSYPDAQVLTQMKWLDGIMDESERMHGLIADLLLLARMDDENVNNTALIEEEVNLSEAVENTLFSFEAIAFERNLTIEDSIEPALTVKAVPSRLVRLPDILMDNACKYARADSIVKVTLRAQGDKVMLRIFNTGPAIDSQDMNHLFDRFYRADESRSDDIPGYGLGLSIAKSIVEESEGTIEVENAVDEAVGTGVAFVVSLPRAG